MANPILLLHGALGALQQLEPLKQVLTGNGREVYSMNFSGHGGNSFSEEGFGIDVFSKDVLSFLDQHNLALVDIFGYSMGGYVAVWLAHQFPGKVGRIVTLGTKFDWDVASAQKEVGKMDADKIIGKIPAFARILEMRHAPNDWKELLSRTKEMMADLGDKPMITTDIAKSISHDCLVLLGDIDDMADRSYSEKIAGSFPNGKFMLLNQTPHPIEKVDIRQLAALNF